MNVSPVNLAGYYFHRRNRFASQYQNKARLIAVVGFNNDAAHLPATAPFQVKLHLQRRAFAGGQRVIREL